MEAVSLEYRSNLQIASDYSSPQITALRGTLVSPLRSTADTSSALLSHVAIWDRNRWENLPGRVQLLAGDLETQEGLPGDRITAKGTWRLSEGRSLPGEMDWGRYHLSRGIVGSFFIAGEEALKISPAENLGPVLGWLRIRSAWQAEVRTWLRSSLPEEKAALVSALVTGERKALSRRSERALQEAGLLHLTAISGLHVTALLVLFPLLLTVVGIKRRWRAAVGIPLALLFLALVGLRAPIARATFMGMALMVGQLLDRPTQSLNLLGGAALVWLFFFPADLWLPGFQLSYLVVAGLILLTKAFDPREWTSLFWRAHYPTWLPAPGFTGMISYIAVTWILSGLLTSLVAVAVSAPLTAYHFHFISWKGILGNLLGVPLASLLSLAGFATLFLHALSPWIAGLLAPLLGTLSGWILEWADWVERLEWGFWRVIRPTPLETLLVFSFLLLFSLPPGWKARSWLSRRTLTFGLLACLIWVPAWGDDRDLEIHFLDIGQGDCCLLRFSDGKTLLVDTGPPAGDPGRFPLAEALRALRIKQLDGFLISHPELDHIGNLPALISEFRIGALFCSGDTNETELFRKTVAAVVSQGIPVYQILAGDKIKGFGKCVLHVLHPTRKYLAQGMGTRNDRSVVFRLDAPGTRVLFPGDIGEEAEIELVEAEADLRCDVLKVPHHGSATSSTSDFLDRVRPAISVICVGENRFGHPTPEVMHRLSEVGSTVFTTGGDGTLGMRWDGRTWDLLSW
jgi:competence protein ComEC